MDPGRSPAAMARRLRPKIRRYQGGLTATTAAARLLPHLRQKRLSGSLPAPHTAQMRSPGLIGGSGVGLSWAGRGRSGRVGTDVGWRACGCCAGDGGRAGGCGAAGRIGGGWPIGSGVRGGGPGAGVGGVDRGGVGAARNRNVGGGGGTSGASGRGPGVASTGGTGGMFVGCAGTGGTTGGGVGAARNRKRG